MKLSHHKSQPPPPRGLAKRRVHAPPKDEQARRVERAQHAPHHHLRGAKAQRRNQRLADPREEHGADKRARHGAGKGEVVVALREGGGRAVAEGRAVEEHVVGGLQVERLLDLGVRGEEEVQEGG